jgi:hypothetical protein
MATFRPYGRVRERCDIGGALEKRERWLPAYRCHRGGVPPVCELSRLATRKPPIASRRGAPRQSRGRQEARLRNPQRWGPWRRLEWHGGIGRLLPGGTTPISVFGWGWGAITGAVTGRITHGGCCWGEMMTISVLRGAQSRARWAATSHGPGSIAGGGMV